MFYKINDYHYEDDLPIDYNDVIEISLSALSDELL